MKSYHKKFVIFCQKLTEFKNWYMAVVPLIMVACSESQTSEEIVNPVSETTFVSTSVKQRSLDSFEGYLNVNIIDNFADGSAEIINEIRGLDSERTIQIKLRKHGQKRFKTGDKVRVTGRWLSDDVFDVSSIEQLDSEEIQVKKGPGNKSPSSPRSVAIILIDLLDGSAKMTAEEADAIMWGATNSANDLYLKSSRGATRFLRDSNNDGQADIFGPYTVQDTGAGKCSYGSWGSAALTQAKNAGNSFNSYDHFVYVLPSGNGCSFGGIANLGGTNLWLNIKSAFALAHELGHNLNMHHASTDPENDGRINSEYGDQSCFMGASYRNVYLNAPHHDQLNYLGRSSTEQDVGSVGTRSYTLMPLASDENEINGLRLISLPTNTGDKYYLSYRDGTSYDGNLSTSYRSGVSIHRYPGSGSIRTKYIKTLIDGETLVDEINGLRIRQIGLASDASSVDIEVAFNAVCGAQLPTIELESRSGGYREVLANGEPAQYVLSITNNDDSACPATEFGVSVDWTSIALPSTFTPLSLNISPGEQASMLMTVDSETAPEGLNLFYVNVVDIDGLSPSHPVDRTFGHLVIDNLGTRPEPPTQLSAETYRSKGKDYVSLNWQPSSSSNVTRYRVYRNADILPTYVRASTGTAANFRVESGTYTYYVAAEADNGKVSTLSDGVQIQVGR